MTPQAPACGERRGARREDGSDLWTRPRRSRGCHLEIEIRHRRLSEEHTEQLAIGLSATPSFEGFAQFLQRQAPWPWLALQPWLSAAQMVQASWRPWLVASSALLAAASRPIPDDAPQRRT